MAAMQGQRFRANDYINSDLLVAKPIRRIALD
jgi:hypothetical protein